MFNLLKADLLRKAEWYDLPPKGGSILRMAFSDGSTAQILYRVMRFFQTHHLKPIAAIVYRLNAVIGHVVIGRGAEFGRGFVILHSFGIVVNSSVRAGEGLIMEHDVTIGAEKGRSPVLGNNVFIGAGARLIGPIVIGNDVRIGANAVVTKDVPDGATVVGIPGRVVRIYGTKPEGLDADSALTTGVETPVFLAPRIETDEVRG